MRDNEISKKTRKIFSVRRAVVETQDNSISFVKDLKPKNIDAWIFKVIESYTGVLINII